MKDERLGIYLQDHLALIVGEIELVGRCRSNNEPTSIADFLRQLKVELTAQKVIVEEMLERNGGTVTVAGHLKQGAAWFAEKLGRFKLNDTLFSYSKLSRVVELEMLTAAAQERVAMWDNLNAVAERYPTLNGIAFPLLLTQSQQHFEELNTRRRFAALVAFSDDDP